MTRVIYVNGRYLDYADAAIHAEDRGFQFADAVYEVCEVRNGRLVDEARHIQRLERSLKEIRMPMPMSAPALGRVMRETLKRNRVTFGILYLQVTRGQARRDFLFPDQETPQSVIVIGRHLDQSKLAERAALGIAVKTMPDNRWSRCDLKTVMLLPACLAKDSARQEGAQEAWFVDADGFVTEGAASNAWIVDPSGTLITRPVDQRILAGVTRASTLDAIRGLDLRLRERSFTVEEALKAKEAFITSATGTVMPVVKIDGVSIANGKPGQVTMMLRLNFHRFADILG
jgi:D-alanine transaminase